MRVRIAAAFATLAMGQFAAPCSVVASPETSARVERLDRAYRGVNLTLLEHNAEQPSQDIADRTLIRGRAITLKDNGELQLRYEACLNATVFLPLGNKATPDMEVVRSDCKRDSEFGAKEDIYPLLNIRLETINARQKVPRQGAAWYEVGFELAKDGFRLHAPVIHCPSRQTCEMMADDLRALVKTVQALDGAVTRIKEHYRGIVFTRGDAKNVLLAKADLIDTNLAARLRTRQQVCVRTQDQDCDRDKLWRERIALADIAKLSSGVEIDDVGVVSDDKTIGVVTVKCAEDGCWRMRIGGEGGKVIEGLNKEEIHCKIGDGCQQMKKDLELLIALATASEHAERSRDETEKEKAAKIDNGSTKLPQLPACCTSTPGSKPQAGNVAPDGVLPPDNVFATAEFERDGTVNISYTDPGPGHQQITLRYPPAHPKYEEVKDACVESGFLQPFLCVLLNKR